MRLRFWVKERSESREKHGRPVGVHTTKSQRLKIKPKGLCSICKINRAKIYHHTQYTPHEITIEVCGTCHGGIHSKNPVYRRFLPKEQKSEILDYHKKSRATIWMEKDILARFKELCIKNNVSMSFVFESHARSDINRSFLSKIIKRN